MAQVGTISTVFPLHPSRLWIQRRNYHPSLWRRSSRVSLWSFPNCYRRTLIRYSLFMTSLSLTLENSVIRVNKAKATSITNIEEWTSAFTAYLSVIISKHPSRTAELLEYLSLIRYAAKYHRGPGWGVYDVTFRQKAAANKFIIKWSTIDTQLWLKTFTVALSLMKEEFGFFQWGPSIMPSTVRGNTSRTCHNFNKGFSCARTPCT